MTAQTAIPTERMTRFEETPAGELSLPLVLASGSPRRRELVERLGFEPRVLVSDIPERRRDDETADAYTARLAEEKAEDVRDKLTPGDGLPEWLLAADTVVSLEGRVLEKPADEAEAVEMLSAMSGGWHRVVTSFCWLQRDGERRHVETVATEVRMRTLPEPLLESYAATGEPMDKAGAYGIQDFGAMLVEELRGSYFNVVGLPISRVVAALESLATWDLHPLLSDATMPRFGASTER